MEELINSIADNVFQYVSINKQENVEQWKKDKDEFKDQLTIEINAIKDKEVRNAVIARLVKSSENENAKNFVNANGSVNIGKIKDSTKSIQTQVEREIVERREIEQHVKDSVKEGVTSVAQKELQLKQIEKDFKGNIPKNWSEEIKRAFLKKMAEFDSKISQYNSLIEKGVSKDEALKALGISKDEQETFLGRVRRSELSKAIEKLNSKAKEKGLSEKEKKNLEKLTKGVQQIDQAAVDTVDKAVQTGKGNFLEGIQVSEVGQSLTESQQGIEQQDEVENVLKDINSIKDSAKVIDEEPSLSEVSNQAKDVTMTVMDEVASQSEVSSQTKEIILAVMDEGIDTIDEFNGMAEEYLAGIEDETLRTEVSKAIDQLTKLQKVGDSEKSFRELLEAGELDESIIDSAFENQIPKIEDKDSTIQDSVASTVYIEKSEPIAIDPKWEKMCQEAQERGETLNGETLERLLGKYMQEEGLQQVEAPSTLGEKAGEENELTGMKPPVAESAEVEQDVSGMNPKEAHSLDENGEDREDDDKDDKNSVERREYADKDGGNKRVAILTNDENGEIANIQVFKSLISNVRMGEIEEVTNEIGQLAKSDRTTEKEEKQDVLE